MISSRERGMPRASMRAKASPSPFFGPNASTPRDVYVNVFLRGAMDGLTTVVPYADGDLYVARPTLAVARALAEAKLKAAQGEASALPFDWSKRLAGVSSPVFAVLGALLAVFAWVAVLVLLVSQAFDMK